MKHLRLTFSALFAMAVSMQTLAQRENILINQDWNFRFSHQVDKNSSRRVDLPHTWNAQDALSGKPINEESVIMTKNYLSVPSGKANDCFSVLKEQTV